MKKNELENLKFFKDEIKEIKLLIKEQNEMTGKNFEELEKMIKNKINKNKSLIMQKMLENKSKKQRFFIYIGLFSFPFSIVTFLSTSYLIMKFRIEHVNLPSLDLNFLGNSLKLEHTSFPLLTFLSCLIVGFVFLFVGLFPKRLKK